MNRTARRHFRVWLWLVTALGGVASAAAAPPPLALSQALEGLSASRHLWILEDPGRRLTLEAVTRPEMAARFRPLGMFSSQGLSASAWWVRLEVVNPADRPLDWLLQITHPTLDYLDVHHLLPGRPIQSWQLGDRRPFSARPIPFETPVVPLTTPAAATSLVHLRLAYDAVGFADADLLLWTPREFATHRDLNGLLLGLYLGGLAFMVVYNLFVYASTGMREYGWYVAYIALVTLATAAVLGLGHRYLYPDSALLTELMPTLTLHLALLVGAQFCRIFLDTPTLAPRLDRLFTLVMALFAGSILLMAVGFKQAGMQLALLVGLILVPAPPLLGAWLWWRGHRKARLVTLAWSILLVGIAVSWGRRLGYVPSSLLSFWAGRLGVWLEAAFLSLALVDHINVLRQEKDRATQRERDTILRAKTELESRVEERTRDLQAARQRADAANRAKSDFLANMSHEIRTPMNAILGTGHLILKTALTDRQRQYLTTIHGAAHALLDIINDILDFSRIEAGGLRIERIPFNLPHLIEEVARLMTGKADEKGLEFLVNCQVRKEVVLIGDPLRLRQVLINLLGNALKFTARGEVAITVAPILETPRAVTLRIQVTDTGIGMDSAQMAGLFQPFFQADISHSRTYGGTGLGLAICQRLVTAMDGRLEVSSAPGVGSTFTVTLPFDRGQAAPGADLIPGEANLRGLRVLVVDDNAQARTLLADMLESCAFRVETVASGFAALDLLQQVDNTPGEQPFGLVLMDWKMPAMDGLETARRIRQEAALSHLPTIIMVSAYSREEVIREAETLGLAGCLTKPVTPSELFDTVMGALGGQRPEAALPAAAESWQPDPATLERIRGARVLLVDDIPINRDIAREFLTGYGLDVTMATGGQEAVDLVARQDFDLVLMDIQMPGLNGFQATARIRALPRGRHLPIVAMTAHALIDDRQRSLEAGMDDHVTKPIDPATWFDKVARWLPARPARPQAAPEVATTSRDLPSTPPTVLPGLDLERALRLVHGNHRLLRHSLLTFARDYRPAGAAIAAAGRDGDWPRIAGLIHTLKGLSGSLGMTRLHDLARRVNDDLTRQQRCDPAPVAALVAELTRILAELDGLERTLPALPVTAPVDPESFEQRCQTLAELLRQGDFSAPDQLPGLAASLGGQADARLARLEAQVMDFDNDAALATLAELRQSVASLLPSPPILDHRDSS
ncbi:MAG: response regulator [Magnetococcales bacterium]|nr:response regulator [Magnetococcales bacterium]